jgi:L-malate glycosyltransferase
VTQPTSTAESSTTESPVIPGENTRHADPAAHRISPLPLFLMIDTLQTGGSERQFVTVSRALDPERFRIHLGCIRATGALLDGMGVDTFPLGGSLYGVQSWRTRINLWRHLRGQGIAIAHAFDFYTNLLLIPAARLAGVPVVIGSQRQLGDLLTPRQFRAQLMVFKQCDAVVCNSHAAAKLLIAAGLDERKITVIWNGLAQEGFAEASPALPARSGWRRVGMIARMNSRVKNHSLLLRAAARLKQQNSELNVEFVLAGDGPLRPELEREAAELGLGDGVQFLGDRRDIPAILASLDLTVLPSDSESLSNAIIESMAAGVPVVATRVGANAELVTEDRGALVPVGDESALANEIGRLLRDDQPRIQMGHKCRSFAVENFDIGKMRQHYEQLYEELLHRKGAFSKIHAGRGDRK